MAAPFLALWQASEASQSKADAAKGISPNSKNSQQSPATAFTEIKVVPISRSHSRARKTRKSHASPPPSPRPKFLDEDEDLDDLSLTLDGHDQTAPKTMNNTGNLFPSFLDTNSPTSGPNNSTQRPSPTSTQQQQQQYQVNGTGGGMNGMGGGMGNGMNGLPMNAGQQMDVNMLYQKVMELSEVLKENRERTQGIVAGAEELAVSSPNQRFPDFGTMSRNGQSSLHATSTWKGLFTFMYHQLTDPRRLEQLAMEQVRRYRKPMQRSPVKFPTHIPAGSF